MSSAWEPECWPKVPQQARTGPKSNHTIGSPGTIGGHIIQLTFNYFFFPFCPAFLSRSSPLHLTLSCSLSLYWSLLVLIQSTREDLLYELVDSTNVTHSEIKNLTYWPSTLVLFQPEVLERMVSKLVKELVIVGQYRGWLCGRHSVHHKLFRVVSNAVIKNLCWIYFLDFI